MENKYLTLIAAKIALEFANAWKFDEYRIATIIETGEKFTLKQLIEYGI